MVVFLPILWLVLVTVNKERLTPPLFSPAVCSPPVSLALLSCGSEFKCWPAAPERCRLKQTTSPLLGFHFPVSNLDTVQQVLGFRACIPSFGLAQSALAEGCPAKVPSPLLP